MSEQTSEAVHVWRAVGPNAAELWNQCVNCRADETSVEGRLPCRAATTERASTTGGDGAGGLAPLDAEDLEALDSARTMTPLTLHMVAAAMVHKHLAARSVPASGAGEDGLREAVEAAIERVFADTEWFCGIDSSHDWRGGKLLQQRLTRSMRRALLDRHAPGGGETGGGGSV